MFLCQIAKACEPIKKVTEIPALLMVSLQKAFCTWINMKWTFLDESSLGQFLGCCCWSILLKNWSPFHSAAGCPKFVSRELSCLSKGFCVRAAIRGTSIEGEEVDETQAGWGWADFFSYLLLGTLALRIS